MPLTRVAVLLAAVLATGCGKDVDPGRLQIQGRVTQAGEPLVVDGRDVGLGMVEVSLYRLAEDGTPRGEAETAYADEEGNFDFFDGVPPGRYRIAVRQWDPYPQVDRLNGKFTVDNSPLVRELNSADQVLEIDLAQASD